ncbi:GNAT family N-acetyltransferase [Bacillus sp. SD088]|uniref:GNAT family N-acetyltransferase n=1 Tax=Bacillus sp. SD088 TaxID=2782012 RepID=UPI001A96277F|nr:GNAT family N-acetyltransferase [Bacillus sp. SD088]MBO0994878.1 GNAT family N-acetyltransferase [Bacillus sp. SD088]
MEYTFESERLGFRRWQEADKIPFAHMNADLQVMRYFPSTITREESDQLVERFESHFQEKGYGIWALELKETREFLGFIGLLTIKMDTDFHGSTEIGWRLNSPFWKKGYAMEGAKACLNYAFHTLQLPEVYSFTALLNKDSEKVMQRIGMRKVKEFNHPKLEIDHPLGRHVLYKLENVSTEL